MKYRGLLFQKDMAEAAVDGRKTETRRVKKLDEINLNPNRYDFVGFDQFGSAMFSDFQSPRLIKVKCPYEVVGDGIYGRETTWVDEFGCRIYEKPITAPWLWKTIPSLFMPADAARVKFIISEIKVERLLEIDDVSAIAEGIESHFLIEGMFKSYRDKDEVYVNSAKVSYLGLWDSINGKDSYTRNPWVWVIKWEKLEPVNIYHNGL